LGTLVKLGPYLYERTGGMIGSLSHLIREAALDVLLAGRHRENHPGRASRHRPRPGRRGTALHPPAPPSSCQERMTTAAITLLHALPILQTVALTSQPAAPRPSLPPWHAHACLLCAARRGVRGLPIIRVFPHERICARHSRWQGGGPQRPLRELLPEIPHANALHRRLVRHHGATAVTERFLQAQAQTRQWLTGDGPADLKSRWDHRLGLLGEDPYGDPHRPSPDRIELVTYPKQLP
jgi:hypothetical protein